MASRPIRMMYTPPTVSVFQAAVHHRLTKKAGSSTPKRVAPFVCVSEYSYYSCGARTPPRAVVIDE